VHVISVILAWFALAPRRYALACALLAGLSTAGAAQADTYHFNGKAVNGCTLSGKVYTCPVTSLPNEYDQVIIDSGITVNAGSDISFGYNQKLTMSGTARLTSSGNINIANIATNNLNITGGSISAGKTFSVGNQVQTVTADISAGSMVLGSGSTLRLNGTLASNGTVQIASNTTIAGPVRGTIITTGSPATIRGDVTATSRFTLASGGTVNGNITAPVTELLASGSVVTGKVTASTSLVLGSGNTVNGDVDTGQLRLEASNATINGNASVDFAHLQWAGRVSKKIYCKSGTRTGFCDCVNNESGWDVDTANGPRCEAAKPAPGPLDHFLITYDGSASVCAAKTVQVKACGDATCSQSFTGGVDITLSPGGTKVSIGSSGTVSTTVSKSTPGIVDLVVNHAGTAGTRCRNDGASNASCSMNFSGGISFELLETKFRAGESAATTITAKAYNEASKTCVAAFQSQQKDIQYSCAYSVPDSGSVKLGLKDAGTGASAQMVCSPTFGAGLSTVKTSFNAQGSAPLALSYEDAGQLELQAKFEDATGATAVHVAPYHFRFSNLPSKPIRAGAGFEVTVAAYSASGVITKNFDRTRLPAGSTSTGFTVGCLRYPVATPLQPSTKLVEFADGKVTATLSWPEVGSMHLKASTAANFPNTNYKVEGSSGAGTDCASLGPFIPHHYLVEMNEPAGTTHAFYYAGEPIPLRISARNAAGDVTQYYSNGQASEAVGLDAFDDTGSEANPNGGKLSLSTVGADKFDKGVALAGPAYASPIPATGTRVPLAPTTIRLRARNTAALTSTSPDTVVSSADAKEYETARPLVRNGRLRIATRFGRAGSTLQVPVTAEYWTGKSWLLNDLDNVTVVPANAIAQRAQAHADSSAAPGAQTFGPVRIVMGKAELPVTSSQSGWVDLAFNLGVGAGVDQSCLATHPASSRANLPWLQSFSSCIDPSGRATFGIYATESRRIIHVREVFR